MKIVFRVDASYEIGSGHTMRCLTLADALRKRGHSCEFIVREQPGHLIELISHEGYIVNTLPMVAREVLGTSEYTHSSWLLGGQKRDAEETLRLLEPDGCDWLIVDHYGIGEPWEAQLKIMSSCVMVIDDLADRPHNCEILLDQNMGRLECDYNNLATHDCVKLIGPEYALLRPEFAAWREESLNRRNKKTKLSKLLVSLGGADKDNVTNDILDALEASFLPSSLTLTLVLGHQYSWLEMLEKQAVFSRFDVNIVQGVNNMAELMSNSDLAIGAAGSTSWERCCLGVPTILCVTAKNQLLIARTLSEIGAAMVVDSCGTNRRALVMQNVNKIVSDYKVLSSLTNTSSKLVDGKGVNRVINTLESIEIKNAT